MCKQRFLWPIGNSFVVDWLQGSRGHLKWTPPPPPRVEKIPPAPSAAFSMSNPSFPGGTKKNFLTGAAEKKGEERRERKRNFPPSSSSFPNWKKAAA